MFYFFKSFNMKRNIIPPSNSPAKRVRRTLKYPRLQQLPAEILQEILEFADDRRHLLDQLYDYKDLAEESRFAEQHSNTLLREQRVIVRNQLAELNRLRRKYRSAMMDLLNANRKIESFLSKEIHSFDFFESETDTE